MKLPKHQPKLRGRHDRRELRGACYASILGDQIAFSKNFGAGNLTADDYFPLAAQALQISGN
jgi:hypothetical protein